MRRVELHQVEDLKLLQNLKGNEYIFLKIYEQLSFKKKEVCYYEINC